MVYKKNSSYCLDAKNYIIEVEIYFCTVMMYFQLFNDKTTVENISNKNI